MNTIKKWNYNSNVFISFFMFFLLILGGEQLFAQGVGISEISITPAASSILELRSTQRGFLLPRMTTAQRNAIVAPVVGLVIYNSETDRLNFYTGASWIPLITSDSIGTATGTSLALGGGTALATTNQTGTGNLVLANTPTLVTPVLGAATGTSLALGGGTVLTTTNQTGTGNLVLATSPTLTTPTLGAATGTSLALGGGTALTTTNQTGTGNLVLANTPTLVTPVLGAATGTSLALGGGTALTTTNQTGTGNLVLATAPTITGTTLAAGTLTVDPLTFTSGTNLTTAAAGAVEYDGTAFYATSIASTRQVVVTEQFISNTADFTMASVATAQSPFAAANDVITVAGSTTYFFEAYYSLTTGTTTHTTGTLFGGTATFTSIAYYAMIQSGVANALGTVQSTKNCINAANNVLNATSTAAGTVITLKGVMRINAAGTIIPQIQFSAGPGGTNLGKANSWFRMYPVGTNTTASVGNVN